MNFLLHYHWILIAAIWYFFNGILHDLFVVIRHKGKYDRVLLRLLMDGHVMILSGILLLLCWLMVKQHLYWGALISAVVAAFMLVYCIMIFPFLKSFVTIILSLLLLVSSLFLWNNML